MLIKKFIAQNLPEALSKVKEDFGDDAVILKTRFNNKGTGANKDSRYVEVTAAIDKTENKTAAKTAEKTVVVPPTANRLKDALPQKVAKPAPKVEKPAPEKPVTQIRTPSEILTDLRKDIAAIQRDLAADKNQSIFGQPSGLQLEVGRALLEKHLPEPLVLDLLREIPPSASADWNHYWNSILDNLARLLEPGEPIKIVDTGATVVMLIGPAGSGKTSAAARLAFQFSMEQSAPVSLVTTDNFRADSREQLMALSNVIGCTFTNVASAEELTVMLKTCKQGLVLIDTSGVSTQSDADELAALIGAANPHEIHLVVSADTAAGDISDFITANPDIDVDKIFVTKLDQSRYRGGIIGAAIDSKLKFSYQSGVRELPGDIALFDPKLFVSALKPRMAKNEVKTANLEEVMA